MTSVELKAICDAIALGVLTPDSPLSVEEFQKIHEAAQQLRKQAVRELIDEISKGKIRVYAAEHVSSAEV